MDDPDKELHKIFHHTHKKKDRKNLEFLFSGRYIPNIQYYYVFEEKMISWESKVIEKYANKSSRIKKKAHKLFVSLYSKLG